MSSHTLCEFLQEDQWGDLTALFFRKSGIPLEFTIKTILSLKEKNSFGRKEQISLFFSFLSSFISELEKSITHQLNVFQYQQVYQFFFLDNYHITYQKVYKIPSDLLYSDQQNGVFHEYGYWCIITNFIKYFKVVCIQSFLIFKNVIKEASFLSEFQWIFKMQVADWWCWVIILIQQQAWSEDCTLFLWLTGWLLFLIGFQLNKGYGEER